jgi:hypothetical protein
MTTGIKYIIYQQYFETDEKYSNQTNNISKMKLKNPTFDFDEF